MALVAALRPLTVRSDGSGLVSRSGLVFLARDVAGADWARTGGRRCGPM